MEEFTIEQKSAYIQRTNNKTFMIIGVGVALCGLALLISGLTTNKNAENRWVFLLNGFILIAGGIAMVVGFGRSLSRNEVAPIKGSWFMSKERLIQNIEHDFKSRHSIAKIMYGSAVMVVVIGLALTLLAMKGKV